MNACSQRAGGHGNDEKGSREMEKEGKEGNSLCVDPHGTPVPSQRGLGCPPPLPLFFSSELASWLSPSVRRGKSAGRGECRGRLPREGDRS